MSKLKICLSGVYYPLAMLRYFEAALRRRKDIELITVGPDTGYWIPWNNGMTVVTETKIKFPDFPLSKGNNFPPFYPINFIETRNIKPDLWLQIDAGFYFEGRPKTGKNFIVGTDPHVLNYDRQRMFCDQFFCMQKVYAKSTDIYLPYAFDPVWHSPIDNTEEVFDVAFTGLHYSNRMQLFNALKEKGIKVNHTLGKVYNEARLMYNQAPIGINWSSLQDLTARVFELLGMKRLAVVNKVPDLDKFFENGRDLIVFEDLDEAVRKIIYYLEYKDSAKQIAEQGHKAVQSHTWDARIEQILSYV